MGEIKLDIPGDMEAAFERAFRAEDKAAAVHRVIESEIARRQEADAASAQSFDAREELRR